MKRKLLKVVRVVAISVLVFIVVIALLTIFGPAWGSFQYISPLPLSPPDVQPTITYLSVHPDALPDHLYVQPPPGTVKASDDMCISIDYQECDAQGNLGNLPSDQSHCGPDAAISIDGRQVNKGGWRSSGSAISVNGYVYSDAGWCFSKIVGPGSHLFTVDAYPMGHYVHYAWVWTVEP